MTIPDPRSWPRLFVGVAIAVVTCVLVSCVSTRSLVDSKQPASPPESIPDAETHPVTRTDSAAAILNEDHLLTPPECVAYACTHNRAIARAQWRTMGARADVDSANAELMPSIHADGAYTTRNNDPGVSFNGLKFVTGDRSVGTGDVIASVPLFTATNGKRWTARHELSAMRADSEHTLSDISATVTSAIYDLIEARERIDLIASSVKSLGEQARIAEDRQKAGLALSSDALADQVRLAERQQDRLHASNDAEMIQSSLNRLLGLPLRHHLQFAPLAEVAIPELDESRLATRALTQRQDLTAMRERLAQSLSRVHEADSSYLPQASLFGGLYGSTDSLLLNRHYFGAGVNISIPLLDSGQTAAQIDAARAVVGEQQEATQDLVDQIREEVHQAVVSAQETSARLPVARQADALAQLRLDQVQDQYRHGVADMTTVLDAESEQVRTRLDAMHAQMDMHRALEQLDRVTQGTSLHASP